MTIGDLIRTYERELEEAGISDARFEITEIISDVIGSSPSELMLRISDDIDRTLTDPLIERLKENEPVSYILGRAYFYNEVYEVGEGVLIPRPDTEILVSKALETILSGGNKKPVIWDLCTGTGCVGISLGNELYKAGITPKIYLVDKFEEALKYTKKNLGEALDRDRYEIVEADILDDFSFPESPDYIISNPPYINSKDMRELPLSVTDHEPSAALFGISEDGLMFYRRIADLSEDINEGGAVIVEHGYDQAELVRGIFSSAGLKDPVSFRDFGGNMRVTMAFR
ncbi:MAG: peptide chain release factor N(5)-glutamine methyltransferase [Clostridiales bacterium]|nr:peptide chain release factor N(5)-glutamine methyltransferase [Clostridiales bacterium]